MPRSTAARMSARRFRRSACESLTTGPPSPRKFLLYSNRGAEDQEQVFMKATQLGISAFAVRLAMFHCDVFQRKVLYCMPTDGEMRTFSRHRIAPILQASPHLQSRIGAAAVNNVDM